MKRRWRFVILGSLALILALGLLAALVPRYDAVTRTDQAIADAKAILTACEAYQSHPDSPGKYPTMLADLLHPPFQGRSYLRNGEADLIDPWGQPYRYAVVNRGNGEQEIYVWGERVVDGKLQLFGAKLTTDGKTLLIGTEP